MKKIKNRIIKKNEITFIVSELHNLNEEIKTSFRMMDDILKTLKNSNIGDRAKWNALNVFIFGKAGLKIQRLVLDVSQD